MSTNSPKDVAEVASHDLFGWLPIETAPKDGTHVIAADFTPGSTGFGWCGKDSIKQPFADVVHWFECDAEKGFYPSSYGTDPEAVHRLTHWMPINPLPNVPSVP